MRKWVFSTGCQGKCFLLQGVKKNVFFYRVSSSSLQGVQKMLFLYRVFRKCFFSTGCLANAFSLQGVKKMSFLCRVSRKIFSLQGVKENSFLHRLSRSRFFSTWFQGKMFFLNRVSRRRFFLYRLSRSRFFSTGWVSTLYQGEITTISILVGWQKEGFLQTDMCASMA